MHLDLPSEPCGYSEELATKTAAEIELNKQNSPGNRPTFYHHLGLRPEVCRIPEHQVGPFADLHRSDRVRHSVRLGRIDCVLSNVPLDSIIVICLVTAQGAALFLHLVCSLPCPRDDLPHATHRL